MKNRNTIQRSLVLGAVRQLRNHPTADEVYESTAQKHPDISRGTVYRNLNLLSELGELRKVEVPSGATRFDHMCHEHYHARCIRCGRVSDVEMAVISGLEKGINDACGFEFISHDIVFKGICPKCKA